MAVELTHGSLFSGIGGFDLGFDRAGIDTLWQVERDPYCLKVLEKHWPDVTRYTDVRSVHGILAHPTSEQDRRIQQPELSSNTRAGCQQCLAPVDIITGGFPCQPFSVAGKRRGTADDRHLWPEMRRIIEEVRPRWVVAENVPGLIKLALDAVLSDLEALGYTVGAVTVPACAVDAPHRRDRLWIMAHAEHDGRADAKVAGGAGARDDQAAGPSRAEQPERSGGRARRSADVADTAQQLLDGSGHTGTAGRQESPDGGGADAIRHADTRDGEGQQLPGQQGEARPAPGRWWSAEPAVGRVAHGVPRRVDRLKALGNAIGPAIAEEIGAMIIACERQRDTLPVETMP